MLYRKGQLPPQTGLQCRVVSLNWGKRMRPTSAKKAFQGNGKNEQKLLIPEGLGQIPVARLGTTTTFLLWCLQTHGCANVEQTHDIFPRIWIILSFKYQRNHKNLSSETEKTRMSMAVHPSSVPWALFILKRSRRDIKVDSTGPWRPCHLALSSAAATVAGVKQNSTECRIRWAGFCSVRCCSRPPPVFLYPSLPPSPGTTMKQTQAHIYWRTPAQMGYCF